jgi:AhpD family alkylhydroperoxidase
MEKNYPEIHHHTGSLVKDLSYDLPATLAGFGQLHRATLAGFGQLHRATLAEGALDTRTKELMALAISIAVRCDGCIAHHVHDTLKAGAIAEEIKESIGVAVLMGGGPALMDGAGPLEALRQFEARLVPPP